MRFLIMYSFWTHCMRLCRNRLPPFTYLHSPHAWWTFINSNWEVLTNKPFANSIAKKYIQALFLLYVALQGWQDCLATVTFQMLWPAATGNCSILLATNILSESPKMLWPLATTNFSGSSLQNISCLQTHLNWGLPWKTWISDLGPNCNNTSCNKLHNKFWIAKGCQMIIGWSSAM